MKTNNFKIGLKVLAIFVVIVITFGKTKGQSASDDAVMPLNYVTAEGFVMEPVEKVYDNSAEINNWINTELDNAINDLDLEKCKFSTMIYLQLDKNGKVSNFELKDTKSEVAWLLEDILKNAPEFQPVTMNGHPTKMNYEIPVTVEIR